MSANNNVFFIVRIAILIPSAMGGSLLISGIFGDYSLAVRMLMLALSPIGPLFTYILIHKYLYGDGEVYFAIAPYVLSAILNYTLRHIF